jgi:hypothetical protein
MKGLLVARRRTLLAGAVLALVPVLTTIGVALGTPPTGSVTATPLGDGITVNTAKMNLNDIKFRTRDPVRVFHVRNVGGPGFSAGWHKHTGPVIIVVTAGSLTFYDRARRHGAEHARATRHGGCRVTTVTAGGSYIETAGQPIQVLNTTPAGVNNGTAEWVTTQIIPPGASTREDETPGFCGV